MNKSYQQQEDLKEVKTTNMDYFGQIPSQIGSTSGKATFILFKVFKLEIFQKNVYGGQFLPKFENMFQMCQVKNSLRKPSNSNSIQ